MTESPNIELVRSIFIGWEQGDWFGWLDQADPEIEYVFADGPDPGAWVGVDAAVQHWHEQLRPWDDLALEAYEYRELEDGRILALHHTRGAGKASSVEVHAEGAVIFRVEDGTVAGLVIYWDRDRALADLGLSPEGEP